MWSIMWRQFHYKEDFNFVSFKTSSAKVDKIFLGKYICYEANRYKLFIQFQGLRTIRYVFKRVSEWTTLYSLPECQGTPFSKQAPYLKFKWQQWDSNS